MNSEPGIQDWIVILEHLQVSLGIITFLKLIIDLGRNHAGPGHFNTYKLLSFAIPPFTIASTQAVLSCQPWCMLWHCCLHQTELSLLPLLSFATAHWCQQCVPASLCRAPQVASCWPSLSRLSLKLKPQLPSGFVKFRDFTWLEA